MTDDILDDDFLALDVPEIWDASSLKFSVYRRFIS